MNVMGTAVTRRGMPQAYAGALGLDNPSLLQNPTAAMPPHGSPASTPGGFGKIEDLDGLCLDHFEQEDYLDHLENLSRPAAHIRRTDFLFIALVVAITTFWVAGTYLWLHRPH